VNNAKNLAISATDLSKSYGDRKALAHATFEVPQGSICGFVGPNGSGKTTTIRMLLGLIKPTGGSATVLGEKISEPEKYLSRVGALIEGPAFYPALSGAENLRVLAELGGFPKERVNLLLEKVGLGDRGGSKFKTYSLGMKQRLGIAAALLPDPDLLILDEPTNGLDPSGIQEVRELIRDLAREGKTVFVSSHILSELEMICEYVVMLRLGEVLFAGRTDALLSQQTPMVMATPEYAIDLSRLIEIAEKAGHAVSEQDGNLLISAPPEWSPVLNRLAFEAGITLSAISAVRPTLEETFFELTGDNE
jgi:ABC-2 type transport system ATP-binding protein